MSATRISTRLTLWTAILGALIFGGIAVSLSLHVREAIHELALEQQHRLAGKLAEEIEGRFAFYAEAQRRMANAFPERDMGSAPKIEAFLQAARIESILFSNLVVIDPNGVAIADAPLAPARRGSSFKDRDYFRVALNERRGHVSNPLLGRALETPLVVMSVPVLRDGRVVAVLTGLVDLLKPSFLGRWADFRIGEAGYVAIIAADGTYVIHPDKGRILTQADETGLLSAMARLRVAARPQLGVTYRDATRGPVIATLSRVRTLDWIIVAAEPAAQVTATASRVERLAWIFGLAILAGGLPLIWFGAQRMTRPLANLADWANKAAASPLSIPKPAGISGGSEIETLRSAFAAALDARAKAIETLKLSDERFALATRGSTDGFWDWNIATGEDYFSDRWCEMLGYRRDELAPRVETWRQLMHPEDVEKVARAVKAHLGERKPYDIEFRMRAKSGEYRWFRSRGEAVRDAEGKPVRMAGSLLDITERRRAEEALRASEERLRRAEAMAHTGYYEFDADGENFVSSDELKKLFGFPPGSRAPFAEYVPRLHPEDREPIMAEVRRAAEEMRGFDFQYRIVRPDGSEVTVHSISECMPVAPGRLPRFFGTLVDITERKVTEERLKAALAEKEVLLKEVYHRVKNNLQVVSSLLSMQGAKAGPEGRSLLEESANRVKSMALVHEQLYRDKDLSSIALGSYARELVEHLRHAHGGVTQRVAVTLEVEDVRLGIEQAVPLGLVLNELVSNACKHGYPGALSGRIVIALRRVGQEELELEVSDDGVGLPAGFDPAKAGSLGMQLVLSLARQLDGRLDWGAAARGAGARFALRFAPGPSP